MKCAIVNKLKPQKLFVCLLAGIAAVIVVSPQASAQHQKKPNIVMLMTDDIGLMTSVSGNRAKSVESL